MHTMKTSASTLQEGRRGGGGGTMEDDARLRDDVTRLCLELRAQREGRAEAEAAAAAPLAFLCAVGVGAYAPTASQVSHPALDDELLLELPAPRSVAGSFLASETPEAPPMLEQQPRQHLLPLPQAQQRQRSTSLRPTAASPAPHMPQHAPRAQHAQLQQAQAQPQPQQPVQHAPPTQERAPPQLPGTDAGLLQALLDEQRAKTVERDLLIQQQLHHQRALEQKVCELERQQVWQTCEQQSQLSQVHRQQEAQAQLLRDQQSQAQQTAQQLQGLLLRSSAASRQSQDLHVRLGTQPAAAPYAAQYFDDTESTDVPPSDCIQARHPVSAPATAQPSLPSQPQPSQQLLALSSEALQGLHPDDRREILEEVRHRLQGGVPRLASRQSTKRHKRTSSEKRRRKEAKHRKQQAAAAAGGSPGSYYSGQYPAMVVPVSVSASDSRYPSGLAASYAGAGVCVPAYTSGRYDCVGGAWPQHDSFASC